MIRLNLAIAVILLNIFHGINGRLAVRYTGIFCESNKDYMSEIICKLGFNKDKLTTISLKVNCTRPMGNNLMINNEMKQKGNGYRNTFLNVTFRLSEILGGARNPVAKIIYTWLRPSLKNDLTCPGPIIIDGIVPDFGDVPSVMPLEQFRGNLKVYIPSPRVDILSIKTNFELYNKY